MWCDMKYFGKCLWKKDQRNGLYLTCITLMYILLNFWSFILYLICTSVHSIQWLSWRSLKLDFLKCHSQYNQQINIHTVKNRPFLHNTTCWQDRPTLAVNLIAAFKPQLASCFRCGITESHFYTIPILPSPVQHTQQIIPSFPDMQAGISTFLNIYFCVSHERQGHLLHDVLAP